MLNGSRSFFVLVGLSTVLCPLAAVPALAAEPEPSAEPPRVELVLDVSGSMRAADIGGRSRISVAQQAFNEVVDALPDDTQLGIRVLGATYPGKDKAVACRDTQQLVPVGPVDRAAAKSAIATLRPTGHTPIGLALREGARDLGTEGGNRRIVLITDGEDTCAPPDPCDVARELAAQGTKLVVDTLGLAPDEKVRRQLLCIAGATGGTYAAAQTPEQLTKRIRQLVRRAEDTNTPAPAPVAGGRECAGAPLLGPGVYTDREKPAEHRWYRVPVATGQELRAAVSVAPDRPVQRDYGVLLRATAADGRELVRGTDAGSGRTDVLSAGLRWSAGEPGSSPSPATGEDARPTEVCLVISNSFAPVDRQAGQPGLPFELVVDVVTASDTPDAPGLGRGWLLLLVLGAAGLLTGVLAGWLTRWWIATWRTN
ncbi:VWA domain-containing protein [Plantactinospora sp. KLBMP9567]|uniref:VWA domain-containing protein n=1 Tax=Plantactinospora sp. KLBMP9567 TaxID=3085900 RepID=UPI002981B8FD|nr:VWA domain-containing protein [Plantactinospora sp. KLBMP9567]MDW5326435.1 VWA domain-containing protein [Plantactinospora sp. KLBMP9567]